jgi:hypothetical protein
MGCNGNAWLKPRTDCHDTEARREANYAHEGIWRVDPTSEGTFTLTSYWKDLNCKNKILGTVPSGDNFIFDYDKGNGLQYWAFDMPVKPKNKEITKIRGNWQLFASGSDKVEASLMRSVESSDGKTIGNESTSEVSVSASVSVEFSAWTASVTASVSVGHSSAATESSEVTSQLTNASESTCTATCSAVEGKRAYLFQWLKTTVSAKDSLSMSTCHYVCLYDGGEVPLCPPSDCEN